MGAQANEQARLQKMKAVQACPVARREKSEIITSGDQGAGSLYTKGTETKNKERKEKETCSRRFALSASALLFATCTL
jgi:hypothetical protein